MTRRRRWGPLAGLVPAAFVVVVGSVHAQHTPTEEEFYRRRAEQRIEAGQRHLELGLDCRRKGLTSQAAVEILMAVEASEGHNEEANRVLAAMRTLDAGFWRKRDAQPSRAKIDAYTKKAERVRLQNLEDRMDLAGWAERKGLLEDALTETTAVLRALDPILEQDARGRIVTDIGRIPVSVSERVLADAVNINGRPHLRDRLLLALPEVHEVFEVANDVLRVRSLESSAEATRMHALCAALLPHLEADLGGRPGRAPTVFLFSDRERYGAAVASTGLGPPTGVSGVADYATMTAMVCTADLSTDRVQALALHELTHVFQHGVSPTVMPSWYSEGLADTWGGQGTFGPVDGMVEFGGIMSRHRLAPLLEPDGCIPLTELLARDVLQLWAENPDAAPAFYAQSWALVRFLRTGASAEIAERFARWERTCRGAALGAEAGRRREDDASAARELFQQAFGSDLEDLERGFLPWLRGL